MLNENVKGAEGTETIIARVTRKKVRLKGTKSLILIKEIGYEVA